MKSLLGFVASLVTVLIVFPTLAFSRPGGVQDQDEKTIIGVEREWLRALIQRDRVALDRVLADDFMDSNWKGELHTKKQVLEGMGTSVPYLQHLREINVQREGTTALVRGLNEISDKDGHIAMQIRFTDVLLYRHGHWQAVAAQETPVHSR